jgi:ribonuclease T
MHRQIENYTEHLSTRFRGFLPVVVDVETGGFDAQHDALLEIAAVVVRMDDHGMLVPGHVVSTHVEAFPGSHIDPKSLEVNGIDPDQPLRGALPERAALDLIFKPVRAAIRASGCQRAILVGHNAAFDLGFLNAAVQRTGHKRNPFHPFSCFDTATLAGLAYGQTVLSRAVQAAGYKWNPDEAHSAVYDAERTAALFCTIVNRWKRFEELERNTFGVVRELVHK